MATVASGSVNDEPDALAGRNSDTDVPMDVRQGLTNPFPFAQVPEWVLFAEISPGAKLLYAIICAHINTKRGARTMWPSAATLGVLMGNVTDRTIRRYRDELKKIGAITVTDRFDPSDGSQMSSLVEAHEIPLNWQTYEGVKSVQEAHARLKTGHPTNPAQVPQKLPRLGGGGHRCPGGPDICVRGRRTSASGGP